MWLVPSGRHKTVHVRPQFAPPGGRLHDGSNISFSARNVNAGFRGLSLRLEKRFLSLTLQSTAAHSHYQEDSMEEQVPSAPTISFGDIVMNVFASPAEAFEGIRTSPARQRLGHSLDRVDSPHHRLHLHHVHQRNDQEPDYRKSARACSGASAGREDHARAS